MARTAASFDPPPDPPPPGDAPSIGLILCKAKPARTVEYALWNTAAPIGFSDYLRTETLPETLQNRLPSVEAFAAELAKRKAEEPEE